jgi:hypothetical protein
LIEAKLCRPWADPGAQGRQSFASIKDHVLLPCAGSIVDADARLTPLLDDSTLWAIIGAVPDDWLPEDERVGDADGQREAYFRYLSARLEHPRPFVQEAEARRADANVGAIDPDRANRGRRRE